MNRSCASFLWLWLILLGLGLEACGGEGPSPNISASRRSELLAEVADQKSSAEQLWAYLQKWLAERSRDETRRASSNTSKPRRHDLASQHKENQNALNVSGEQDIRICGACREFIRNFPSDPRAWDARLLLAEEYRWERVSPEEARSFCEQIIAAPDAAGTTRDRARKHLLVQAIENIERNPEEAEKVFAAYENDYPKDDWGAELVRVRLRHSSQKNPQEVEARLRQLLASPNKATAEAAERELSLRTKPLDLKFTATNGKPVDLAKLRGKVVMLYFWATWGDPNQSILLRVLDLRRKYGADEFQIVGIALDEDRSAMRKAIKAYKMDWPNVNDSMPGNGSAIAWRFGNASPQTVWLLDREGVAKQLSPGTDLESEVRKRVENSGY
jgi:thiol-disulfide isomerase/thioredoxin